MQNHAEKTPHIRYYTILDYPPTKSSQDLSPQMRKPNAKNRAPLTRLCSQPALKVRLAASSKRDGNKQRGALRGTPGSACPQPEPNATELPSCAPISARAAQRRRRWWWRGEEGARRLGPEGQVFATSCGTSSDKFCATSCAAFLTCSSFTCRPRAACVGRGFCR